MFEKSKRIYNLVLVEFVLFWDILRMIFGGLFRILGMLINVL